MSLRARFPIMSLKQGLNAGRGAGLHPHPTAGPSIAPKALYRQGMARILYAVIATLPSEELAREYLAWLEDGHVDKVIEGGAHSAMIVRLVRRAGGVDDGLPPDARQVMTQYIFATRELFDRYEQVYAPPLREDGRNRFGASRGVSMSRMIGEVE